MARRPVAGPVSARYVRRVLIARRAKAPDIPTPWPPVRGPT